MQIFKNNAEAEYKSEAPDFYFQGTKTKKVGLTVYRSPFEVLGESIVPNVTTVPAILQGTFVQLTNLDADQSASFLLFYDPTKPFNFGPSAQNVTLNANFIDGDLNVFNFTQDLKSRTTTGFRIPPLKTFIVGIQYAIIPKTEEDLRAPQPVGPEALGNRGYINIVTTVQSLVTTTIRQVFVKSLSDPTTIISSTAYSVPVVKEDISALPSEYLSFLQPTG